MKIKNIATFGIIGGDKRQLFLADSLISSGYGVFLGGFDKLESTGPLVITEPAVAAEKSDVIILPLPCVRTDGCVNAPFASGPFSLDEKLAGIISEKPVFAGMTDRLLRACPSLCACELYDYAAREDFAVLNAVPTAEGALEAAMRNYEGTVAESRCLVTGFGRIGKILSDMLKKLNADVTVAARAAGDRALAQALGMSAVNICAMKSARGYDLIFNTVPSMIFNGDLLMNTDKSTVIIDLASLPGGVDFEAARVLGIDAVRALSLPGRCAPKTAGEIIKTTIFNILEEDNR